MSEDATAGGPGEEAPRFTLTEAQRERAIRAFEKALVESAPPYELGQLNLLHDEEESFITREVERKLYEPQLPNGGQRERKFIERLKKLARDTQWDGSWRAARAIAAWKAVLPQDPKNAGCYYVRKAVTPKTDSESYKWLMALRESARACKQWDRKWFVEMLLPAQPGMPHSGGLPEPVSNFEMECLFVLRKGDGSVHRLVRLRNVLGETSAGEHHKGAVLLDEEAFAAPEKFRKWALRYGNFAWGGNQTDLHKLHLDILHWAAWRVINQVDSLGWAEARK